MSELLLDAVGRRRSPATMRGFHTDRPASDTLPDVVVRRASLRTGPRPRGPSRCRLAGYPRQR